MQICEKTFFFIKNIYVTIINFIHNLVYEKFIQNNCFSVTTFLHQKRRNIKTQK